MIQLRVLRPRFPGADSKTATVKKLPRDVTAASLRELFENCEEYLDKIPETERWNVFYTAGFTNGGDIQKWFGQDVVPFDIDNVVDEDGNSDDERLIQVIFEALEADPEKSIVVKTGNGLQILIQPLRPIEKEDFFREKKVRYDEACDKVERALRTAGLAGKVDKSVFTSNHIFRFPMTENRKEGKAVRNALLLRRKLSPQDFSICPEPKGVSAKKEAWDAEKGEQISEAMLRYFKIDSSSVETGCEFLKQARAEPGDLSEAQWYAMLSIVTRLENGREKAHEYSQNDARYSREGTEKKIDQALSSSGPRTCANIENLWDGCPACPNYKKVNSPVSIKSDNFIATEHSGFHVLSEKGVLKPQVSDLRKYFEREHPYRVHAKSGMLFVYSDQKYSTWSIHEQRAFAQKHFDPEPGGFAVQEFTQSVARVNLIDSAWFTESVRDKINFNNGVYDIKTKTLFPHDPRWGFLYKLPFDFEPDAACPTFDRFIETLACGDQDIVEILCEFIGYAICDRSYWMQKALILIGVGSNGKSAFFEIVEALIGVNNTSYLNFEALKAETNLSHLEGKILNIGDELPYTSVKSTDFFKKLFGGTVMTRRLYHDATPLKNSTKFIFSGNDMPSSDDVSHGFLRRLVIVPFRANFETGSNADPKIVEKMKPELSGIFNRVMAAYQRMEARGDFTSSVAVDQAIADYKNQIDEVGSWIDENIEIAAAWDEENLRFVTLPALYDRYANECVQANVKAKSRPAFTRHLGKKIPGWKERYTRHRVGLERPYIIKGVRFVDHAPKPEF